MKTLKGICTVHSYDMSSPACSSSLVTSFVLFCFQFFHCYFDCSIIDCLLVGDWFMFYKWRPTEKIYIALKLQFWTKAFLITCLQREGNGNNWMTYGKLNSCNRWRQQIIKAACRHIPRVLQPLAFQKFISVAHAIQNPYKNLVNHQMAIWNIFFTLGRAL